MSDTAQDTAQAIAVHPATGQVIELKDATTTDLADVVRAAGDLMADLIRFRQYIVDELAGRLDSANARSERIGDWVLETNPPTSEEYLLDVLESGLEALVDAGELDRVVLERVIVTPPPKPQDARVDKREVNKLKRSDNRKVLGVLAQARVRKPNTRTLKLKHVEEAGSDG